MVIIESRYGDGWLCFNLDIGDFADDDYFDVLNAGDHNHIEFMSKDHDFCIGLGATPNEALEDFERERELFNADIDGYKCNLKKKRSNHPQLFQIIPWP